MAHFSVKHRKPFKNSFCPSLRHRRQTASRCLANFYSPFQKLSKLFVAQQLFAVLAFSKKAHRLKPAPTYQTRRRFGRRHPFSQLAPPPPIPTIATPPP